MTAAALPGLDYPADVGNLGGTLSAAVTAAATTLSSVDFSQLPADPSTAQPLPLMLTDGVSFEVVLVTAHQASATTVTVTRGAYGTTARSWPATAGPPATGTWWQTGMLRPTGVVARRRRTSNSNPSASTTAVAVARLGPILVEPGRLYRLRVNGLIICGAAGNVAGLGLVATTDGSTPTTASPSIRTDYWPTGPVANVSSRFSVVGLYAPSAELTLTPLFMFWRQTGSGTVTVQGNAATPLDFTAEDLGSDPGISGADL